jgi:arylsulfatase
MSTRTTTRREFLKTLGLGAGAMAAPWLLRGAAGATSAGRGKRPHIVLIMADDMGFSDIGPYGGEIRTPNLDRLAKGGLRFTQFYNTARCCPTRASLMTGLYPHQTGVGHMMGDRKLPGYRGDLNRNCVTIAEVLKTAGYRTYMTGKWHVTRFVKPKDDSEKHNWPLQRGFDRFYGTITGAGSYYDPFTLTRDNTYIVPDAGNYYYTDAISDNAARFVADHARDHPDKPFFLYVPYTCSHWPMHALPEDIARYKGRYDAGWDALRAQRHRRQIEMGIVQARWGITDRDAVAPPWEQAKNKPWQQRRMEVYAAMIDRMDQGIGRIVEAIRKAGAMDNTLVLFLADNGGCAEEYGSRGPVRPDPEKPTKLQPMAPDELQTRMQPLRTRDGRPVRTGEGVMPGPADTYIAYGLPWANASNTPFRLYKHWVHEGGIATPLIVHWPAAVKRKGELEHQPGHLIDIMATCVDVSGATYPKEHKGQAIQPMEGRSLVPAFGAKAIEREALYWEHEGNRAVRAGKWKLVAQNARPWELYDMEADRCERNDLAARQGDRVAKLAAMWDAYAQRTNVVLPKSRPKQFSTKRKFTLKAGDALPQEQAPDVAGKAFTVGATIEAKGDGVIVAQGGSSLGYVLYVTGGRLAMATRHRGKLTTVTAAQKLPAGEVAVAGRLDGSGALTLRVAGRQVASGKAPGAIPSMPADGLEVGRDENGAVGDYEVPHVFQGTIRSASVEIDK